MGADWRDSQIRYLVHFDGGGSGMRYRADALAVGVELADGGTVYRVGRARRAAAEPERVRARVGDAAWWFVTRARDIGGAAVSGDHPLTTRLESSCGRR